MGNSCCGDRRVSKQETLSSRPNQISEIPIRSIKPLSIPSGYSINQVQASPSIVASLDDSLIEELEYELKEAKDLKSEDQEKILKVLDSFKANIPSTEQEYFEGFTLVEVRVSDQMQDNRVLFFSNYAMYLLKPADLSYVYRRVHLENIQIILLDPAFKSLIFHMTSNEFLGDLWVFPHEFEDLQNIHNCVQTLFRFITKRFIPVHSFDENLLNTKFNNVSLTFTQRMMDDDFLRANNVVIQEGKLGEIIKFYKKARSSVKGQMIETIVVLTNFALYCLDQEFQFVYRVDLKTIKSLLVTETCDKILIEKNDGEQVLWILGSKFLTELEKMIMQATGLRVALTRKPTLDIEEFLKRSRGKRLRRF